MHRSEHEVGSGPKAHWEDSHYNLKTRQVVTPAKATPTALTSKDSDGKPRFVHIVKSIPCMPCVHEDLEHGEKFGQSEMKSGKMFIAMVSRPVGRKEMMEDPDARASMRNEWENKKRSSVQSEKQLTNNIESLDPSERADARETVRAIMDKQRPQGHGGSTTTEEEQNVGGSDDWMIIEEKYGERHESRGN